MSGNGTSALLCVGLCRRRKPREEFRETPWHGRAASCTRCETFPGAAGGSLWHVSNVARQAWELEQAREKLRAKSRYIRALRLRALLTSGPTSADALTALERPYYDGLARAVARLTWAAVPVRYARGMGNGNG